MADDENDDNIGKAHPLQMQVLYLLGEIRTAQTNTQGDVTEIKDRVYSLEQALIATNPPGLVLRMAQLERSFGTRMAEVAEFRRSIRKGKLVLVTSALSAALVFGAKWLWSVVTNVGR